MEQKPKTRPHPTPVRNLDPDLWREFQIAAMRKGVSAGALLNQVIATYLKLESMIER